jgi:hypothetical protein
MPDRARHRPMNKWMLMVFHGVSEYAECDGNERGKRRRGGNDDDPVVWWFNMRRGLFCVIVFLSKLRLV